MNLPSAATPAERNGSPNGPPLLRFENVVKHFGGTIAVNNVTLELFSHEVLALLGGNGAGKSTGFHGRNGPWWPLPAPWRKTPSFWCWMNRRRA
jgi:branched-chain amino acid transport system ATP-binding protein